MFCASPSLHVIGSLKKLCLKKENVAVLLGTFRCHVLKSTCLLEAHHSQAHPVIGSYGGTRVLETKISQFSALLFLQSRRHHTHVGKKRETTRLHAQLTPKGSRERQPPWGQRRQKAGIIPGSHQEEMKIRITLQDSL